MDKMFKNNLFFFNRPVFFKGAPETAEPALEKAETSEQMDAGKRLDELSTGADNIISAREDEFKGGKAFGELPTEDQQVAMDEVRKASGKAIADIDGARQEALTESEDEASKTAEALSSVLPR